MAAWLAFVRRMPLSPPDLSRTMEKMHHPREVVLVLSRTVAETMKINSGLQIEESG